MKQTTLSILLCVLCEQISVESLVRLIAIMDKHVLDSAELQMNTSPVSDNTHYCTCTF